MEAYRELENGPIEPAERGRRKRKRNRERRQAEDAPGPAVLPDAHGEDLRKRTARTQREIIEHQDREEHGQEEKPADGLAPQVLAP